MISSVPTGSFSVLTTPLIYTMELHKSLTTCRQVDVVMTTVTHLTHSPVPPAREDALSEEKWAELHGL